MVNCAACSISLSDLSRKKGVTFHKFPKNEDIRQQWLAFLARSEETLPKLWHLCSLHFDNDAFERSLVRVRLKPDAIPTRQVLRVKCLTDGAQLKETDSAEAQQSSSSSESDCSEALAEKQNEISSTESNPFSPGSINDINSEMGDKDDEAANGQDSFLIRSASSEDDSNDEMDLSSENLSEPENLESYDIPEDFNPEEMRKQLDKTSKTIDRQKNRIRVLQTSIKRLKSKLTDYNTMIMHARDNGWLTLTGELVIKAVTKS